MGTLFDQRPRENWPNVNADELYCRKIGDLISHLKGLAKEHNISLNQVIEIHRNLQMQNYNALLVNDQDAKDEQLGGFGGLAQELIEAIKDLSNE